MSFRLLWKDSITACKLNFGLFKKTYFILNIIWDGGDANTWLIYLYIGIASLKDYFQNTACVITFKIPHV
jgi:nucleoside-specific outer membrane channel protein Tsx